MVALVHTFRVVSRSGKSRWTTESLSSWIEVLTGQKVDIQDVTRTGWFGVSKVITFEVKYTATPEEAQGFLQVLRQHFKVETAG